MRSKTHAIAAILVLVSFGIGFWVRAGDLDPPPGPIAPTMHTLNEIYNAVDALDQAVDVVSYYASGLDSVLVATADAQRGLVITDIIVSDIHPGATLFLYQGDPDTGGEVKFRVGIPEPGREFHFTSGIAFDPGAELYARTGSVVNNISVTLSGYIPTGS